MLDPVDNEDIAFTAELGDRRRADRVAMSIWVLVCWCITLQVMLIQPVQEKVVSGTGK